MSILLAVAVVCATSLETGDRSCVTSMYSGIKPGMERCESNTAKAVAAAGEIVADSKDAAAVVTSSFCIPLEERQDFLTVAHSATKESMGAKTVSVIEYTFNGKKFVKIMEHKEPK